MMEPFPRVLYVKIFRNYFAFDIINKMRYILCVEALLEACDVTNKDCHLGLDFTKN